MDEISLELDLGELDITSEEFDFDEGRLASAIVDALS
jgi:hypothetical protein